MINSYERLGHKVDGLRAMTLDVESQHCVYRMHGREHESDNCMFLFEETKIGLQGSNWKLTRRLILVSLCPM
jgi:hypothetical protein